MSGCDGRKEGPHQAGQGCTHRSHQGPQLLPVSLDLPLQDVVLSYLLLQLCHPGPILTLTDQLLWKSQVLSPTRKAWGLQSREQFHTPPPQPPVPSSQQEKQS